MEKLALAQVLAQLKSELAVAELAGEGADIKLPLEEIEVELQVVVTSEDAGGLKASFWVIEANAGTKYSHAATQKIKLKLKAEKNGAPLKISGDDRR